MSKQSYLTRIMATAIALVALAAILRFGLGERWFGFYGWATLALVGAVLLSSIIFSRYRKIGLRRWPTLLVLVPIAITALIQIGFWTVFFTAGLQGLGLGLGRSMAIGYVEQALPALIALLTAALLFVLYRGALQR